MGRMRCVVGRRQFRDKQSMVVYLGLSCAKEIAVVVKELKVCKVYNLLIRRCGKEVSGPKRVHLGLAFVKGRYLEKPTKAILLRKNLVHLSKYIKIDNLP